MLIVELVSFVLLSAFNLFIVINPLSTGIVFFELTNDYTAKEKKKIAKEACISALIILLFFAFTGFLLFELFGISIGSFKIIGGLFLFKTAWTMLQGEGKTLHDSHYKADITLVPLAIPLISGPATIVSTVVLFHDATSLLSKGSLVITLVLVLFATYIIIKNSHFIKKVLREKGVRVMNKLMGLILGSLSIQMILNGIKDVIPFLIN